MAAKPIAGTAYVKADGKAFSVAGTCTVSPDLIEREGLVGLSGVAGFKESHRVPFVEIEAFIVPEGMTLREIEAITDATVTVELASGKVVVLRNAWSAGARELNAAEGTATVRFEGYQSQES